MGKSTLGRALVEGRPLALCLDVDELRTRLGKWKDLAESKQVARDLAFELAASHLRRGHDVVLPQLTVRGDVIDHLARVAEDAGARFFELILMAPLGELLSRLPASDGAGHPRDAFSAEEIASQIEYAYAAFSVMAAERPWVSVVDVGGMDARAALAAVRRHLDELRQ